MKKHVLGSIVACLLVPAAAGVSRAFYAHIAGIARAHWITLLAQTDMAAVYDNHNSFGQLGQ